MRRQLIEILILDGEKKQLLLNSSTNQIINLKPISNFVIGFFVFIKNNIILKGITDTNIKLFD